MNATPYHGSTLETLTPPQHFTFFRLTACHICGTVGIRITQVLWY